jgi:hypothetical protein
VFEATLNPQVFDADMGTVTLATVMAKGAEAGTDGSPEIGGEEPIGASVKLNVVVAVTVAVTKEAEEEPAAETAEPAILPGNHTSVDVPLAANAAPTRPIVVVEPEANKA